MSVIIVLSAVSIMGFGTLYVIAPRLSEIVFGQGYRVAGEYIRCLCVMYAVRLVEHLLRECIRYLKNRILLNFEYLLLYQHE